MTERAVGRLSMTITPLLVHQFQVALLRSPDPAAHALGVWLGQVAPGGDGVLTLDVEDARLFRAAIERALRRDPHAPETDPKRAAYRLLLDAVERASREVD